MERSIKKIIEEEFELTKSRIFSRIERINSAQRNMRLQFKNKISQTILTGEDIKGEDNTSLEVNLVDNSTGNIVDFGPESDVTVKIVLLKGERDASEGDDWSVEKFEANIVQEIEGKRPLLAGDVQIKLKEGVGVLDNFKLRHHATKIRPILSFRLGARAVETFDGVHIKEAKTEPFSVKDFRNKYYKKHEAPSLSDEVSRLFNIRKGGKIDKRLQDSRIYTVEDFLIRLLIDPQGLKSIVKMNGKKWDITVNNARACSSDRKMYCYIQYERKIGVVFNILGQVLGLYSENQYASTNMIPDNHKADAQDLLASAYEHWDKVESFDDVNSLQQYFTGLSTFINPPNSVKPDYRVHDNAEKKGESSSRISRFSYQSTSSMIDSSKETGVEDFCSFGNDDVDITDHAFLQLGPCPYLNLETMYQDLHDFLYQNECCSSQINVLNNDEQVVDASDVRFVESEVVQISTRSKRWKKLFCVSRWFSVRKRVSVEGINNRKKQKVG